PRDEDLPTGPGPGPLEPPDAAPVAKGPAKKAAPRARRPRQDPPAAP
ncbi:MAG: hypothetical protein JWO60_1799, partial [Frankiales bacterium]|nr:hypothetical protein [Frankiales bacterium]